MFGRRLFKFVPYLLLIAALVSAFGLVSAQDQTAFLGVTFDATADGAVVTNVMPAGPADSAGLQVGDVITSVNGEAVTADNLPDVIGALNPGDEVTIEVQRDGSAQTLTVTLGDRSEFAVVPAPNANGDFVMPVPGPRAQMNGAFLGVSLDDADAGVTIRQVVPGSPAEQAGLQVDDVITAVNGTAVDSASAVVDAIRALNPNDTVTLDYTRAGESRTATVTLAAGMTGFGFPGTAEAFDAVIYDGESWRVVTVDENNPLYAAGLRSGDVITAIDSDTYTPDTLDEYLNGLDADATVTLSVDRDGETQDIQVPASELQSALTPFGFFRGQRGEPFNFGDRLMMANRAYLGIAYVNLNEQTAQENNVTQTEGALVTQVEANSPAATAGLQANDIITAVDGDSVDAERTLRDRLAAYEPGDTVTLSIMRDGAATEVQATLDEAQGQFNMPFMMPFSGRGQGFGQHPFNVPMNPDGTFPIPVQPQTDTSAPMA